MSKLDLVSIYMDALRIRFAENLMAEHYLEEKIFSFVHFSSGQELAPVAIASKLSKEDRVFGNHRSHAHYLACGGDLLKMYLEMLGSRLGASRGFGGSMHLIDKSQGFWGTSPVLGSIAPIAAGSAFEQRSRSTCNSITVVFIGDGASEEGVVAETLNLVSLWELPLLLVVEDNLYAVNTPARARRPPTFSYERFANAFGLDFYHAPRLEVAEHISASMAAVETVRTSRRPALLLAESFRNFAHSSPLTDDHLGYREEDRQEERILRDHLEQLRAGLLTGQVDLPKLVEMEGQLMAEVKESLTLASKQARHPAAGAR